MPGNDFFHVDIIPCDPRMNAGDYGTWWLLACWLLTIESNMITGNASDVSQEVFIEAARNSAFG